MADFVKLKQEMRYAIPIDHTCRSCKYYKKNNVRHGRCLKYDTDSCAEASCRSYIYYRDNYRQL